MIKGKKYFIIFVILVIDFLFSSIFLKKTNLWKNSNWENNYWRVTSKIYHHDLLPNIDIIENWGPFKKRIITNSLGFRDFNNKNVLKISNKRRILLIGDSFIEGAGYDYDYTIGGLIQKKLGNKFEVLNSAVSSYSPSIYYTKINHFISKGYKFDQALVFLDLSDIYDELFIEHGSEENIIIGKKSKEKNIFKTNFYSLGHFLRDNTISFRIMYLISDYTEFYKNLLRLYLN